MVEPLLNPSPITNLESTACIKQTNKQITKDRKINVINHPLDSYQTIIYLIATKGQQNFLLVCLLFI